MVVRFCDSVYEAESSYKNIKHYLEKNPKTKVHNNKTYTYYGKVVAQNDVCKKFYIVLQLACALLFVPLTLGLLAAVPSFQKFIVRKAKELNPLDQKIKIYVLDKLELDPPDFFNMHAKYQPVRVPGELPEGPRLLPKQKNFQIPEHALVDAEEEIKRIKEGRYGNDAKNSLFSKLATKCIQANDFENAFKSIKEIFSNDIKNPLLSQLANCHLENGNLGGAYNAIKEIYSSDVKNPLLVKLANRHLEDGNLDEAYKVIKEIYSSDVKNPLLVKLVNRHLGDGNLDEAYKVIKEIYSSDVKNPLLVKLANRHLDDGNLDEAYKVIKEIYSADAKNPLLIRLFNMYLSKEKYDRENAHKTVKEIFGDTKKKNPLLVKLANEYLADKDYKNAYDVITGLSDDKELENKYLADICLGFFKANDQDGVKKVVRDMIRGSLLQIIPSNELIKIKATNWMKIFPFLENFVENNYGSFEQHLKLENQKELLQEVQKIVANPEVQRDFKHLIYKP